MFCNFISSVLKQYNNYNNIGDSSDILPVKRGKNAELPPAENRMPILPTATGQRDSYFLMWDKIGAQTTANLLFTWLTKQVH